MIMDCPRCGFKHYIKDGFAHGKQRYQYKRCQYRYTTTSIGYDKEVRYYALKMVSDGASFRQVARTLELSPTTVMNWVRHQGEAAAKAFRKEGDNTKHELVEIDALCTFAGSTKKSAVAMAGRRQA